jgi:hypothetical protein
VKRLSEEAWDGAMVAGRVLVIACIIGALAFCTSGCGSVVQGSARGATAFGIAHQTAGGMIDDARDRALDAVEEAHPQPGPERSAALDAAAAEWQPIGAVLDALREAMATWIEITVLAHAGGSLDVARLLRTITQIVRLYASLVAAAEELGIDDLPALPSEVLELVAAIGGA